MPAHEKTSAFRVAITDRHRDEDRVRNFLWQPPATEFRGSEGSEGRSLGQHQLPAAGHLYQRIRARAGNVEPARNPLPLASAGGASEGLRHGAAIRCRHVRKHPDARVDRAPATKSVETSTAIDRQVHKCGRAAVLPYGNESLAHSFCR
jgi:hypothetical protein